MATEVITTQDKGARDRMFEDLRKNGNDLERQVVKFSSNEPVLNEFGEHDARIVRYQMSGKKGKINLGIPQIRPLYRSTWSVAYPDGKGYNVCL